METSCSKQEGMVGDNWTSHEPPGILVVIYYKVIIRNHLYFPGTQLKASAAPPTINTRTFPPSGELKV